ncbi:DUF1127 domain-containing protein [Mesorhizobium sp. SB112]|uniref:DUF1127 domain-containing protein n=1 Tax=Mesorhizobium sp. SB112 TaxID=3151853 RepID=UPI003266619B
MGTIDTIKSSLGESSFDRGNTDFVRKLNVVALKFIEWLEVRLARRRSRIALMELTDEQLMDIGISRADAYREGIRSFLD